jgi:diamine N-acetyltransferase
VNQLNPQTLELIELDKRAREFLTLQVKDSQAGLVSTVAESYADALFPPDYDNGPPVPWIRGILRNSVPAGFVMCADPTELQKDPWLWRLLVDKSHQGFGLGRFAVEAVLDRYREMGCAKVLVAWVPKDGDASLFYKKLGFVENGEFIDGEVVAEFRL